MNAITRVLQTVLGMVFLGAGGSKLAALPKQVEAFEHFGLPDWFRRAIGSLEILGAVGMHVGLVRRRLAAFASVGISAVLLGAISTHLRERDSVRHLALPTALLGINTLVGWRAVRALRVHGGAGKPGQV